MTRDEMVEKYGQIESFIPLLRSIIQKKFKHFMKCHADCDDALQEALLRVSYLYSCPDGCKEHDDSKTKFHTYVYICVYRHLLSYFHSKHTKIKMKERQLDTCIDVECKGEDRTLNVDTEKLLSELRKRLTSTGHMKVLQLTREGYEPHEVARILDRTPTAIYQTRKKLVVKGTKILKWMLEHA